MKIIAPLILILFSNMVFPFENLVLGAGINNENKQSLRRTSIPYAVARQGQRSENDNEFVRGFLELESYVYSISSESTLIATKKNDRSLLGSWSLAVWPDSVRMKGEGVHWLVRSELSFVEDGEYYSIEEPEKMIIDFDHQYSIDIGDQHLGCYNRVPLRYGDINGDAIDEIVLFLRDDLVVFSLALKRIIFSTQLRSRDELTTDQIAMGFPELENTAPQYISQNGLYGRSRYARFPAMRSFAKIYLDDFNSDGKKDIIVWRKLYESRLTTDPVLGFKLEGELFVHYQLEEGEYQIQTSEPPVEGEFETDPAQQDQIKGWLESKNLTWQSGFPSKSECAGQEGQLIPEMHDVLLNDPDVLK